MVGDRMPCIGRISFFYFRARFLIKSVYFQLRTLRALNIKICANLTLELTKLRNRHFYFTQTRLHPARFSCIRILFYIQLNTTMKTLLYVLLIFNQSNGKNSLKTKEVDKACGDNQEKTADQRTGGSIAVV